MADTATEKLNIATGKVANLVGDLGTSIGALTTKMDKMRMPDEVIRVELKPTLDAISKVSDLQKQHTEDAAKRVDQQTTAFLEAVKPLTEVPNQITSSLQPVFDLSKTLQESIVRFSAATALDLGNDTPPREDEEEKPKKRWFKVW